MAKWWLPKVQHHPENGAWANRFDDVRDDISIKLGADLYKQAKPEALAPGMLLEAIVGVPLPWGRGKDEAKRLHKCNP